jgi:hypothetical protein
MLCLHLILFSIYQRNNRRLTFIEFGNLYIKMGNLENKKLCKMKYIQGSNMYDQVKQIEHIYIYILYIYIIPVNNLPLDARKPQMFTNMYTEQIMK